MGIGETMGNVITMGVAYKMTTDIIGKTNKTKKKKHHKLKKVGQY